MSTVITIIGPMIPKFLGSKISFGQTMTRAIKIIVNFCVLSMLLSIVLVIPQEASAIRLQTAIVTTAGEISRVVDSHARTNSHARTIITVTALDSSDRQTDENVTARQSGRRLRKLCCRLCCCLVVCVVVVAAILGWYFRDPISSKLKAVINMS